MEIPSIYDFTKISDYVKVISSHHKVEQSGKPSTAEGWARELGYNSPQTISMILSGRRPPSIGLTLRLGRHLGLDAKQQRYLELLGELERRIKAGIATESIVAEMREINPNFGLRIPLDAARFAYIANWQYYAIKQLANSPGFKEDPEWIRQRLRKKLSIKEVESALETLLRVGVLTRDPKKKRILPAKGVQSTTDVPSAALRSHHRQMMERAIEALEEQDVTDREITSLTFRFDPKRMKEAKQAIRQFRDWFDTEFEASKSNEVYQLNMQFFSHTNQEERKK